MQLLRCTLGHGTNLPHVHHRCQGRSLGRTDITAAFDRCFSKRLNGFFHVQKGLLVKDSMSTQYTLRNAEESKAPYVNCTPAMIPGSMTKILQPLDSAVNSSFKALLRCLWVM